MTIIEKINNNFRTNNAKYDGTFECYALNGETIFEYKTEESALCCGTITLGNINITTNVAIYDNELLVDLFEEMLNKELVSKSEIILTVQQGGTRHLYLSKALDRCKNKYTFMSNKWVNKNTKNDLLTFLITRK